METRFQRCSLSVCEPKLRRRWILHTSTRINAIIIFVTEIGVNWKLGDNDYQNKHNELRNCSYIKAWVGMNTYNLFPNCDINI